MFTYIYIEHDYDYLIIIEFNSPGVFLSKKSISCLRIDTNNAFLSKNSLRLDF